MLVAIVFAQMWGVLQLTALGSLARTARLRTILLAVAAGLYFCAPLATLVSLAWIQALAFITGTPVYDVQRITSYTIGPPVEELVKTLPILLLLLVPVVRRQWSITDCVLIGAATGAGFGLAEDVYRYGAAATQAHRIDEGWSLGTSLALPFVPSIWTSITSWLPAGAASSDHYFPGEPGFPWLNLHLVWSALGGFAIRIIILGQGSRTRILGLALLLFVSADHAAWNAGIAGGWVGDYLTPPFTAMRVMLPYLPVVALVAAWLIDRTRWQTGSVLEPALAAERQHHPRLTGTAAAALTRLPWSLMWVWEFVLIRRAYHSPLAREPEPGHLHAGLVNLRDGIDRIGASSSSSPLLPAIWAPKALLHRVTRPPVVLWMVLLAPSLLWFGLGGWPPTAGLQERMMGPAWVVVRILSVASIVWLSLQVMVGWRIWPRVLKLPLADAAAGVALRLACGVGAIAFGGYAIWRGGAGMPAGRRLVFSPDAMGQMNVPTALNLAASGSTAMPPSSRTPGPWADDYEFGDEPESESSGGMSANPGQSRGGRSDPDEGGSSDEFRWMVDNLPPGQGVTNGVVRVLKWLGKKVLKWPVKAFGKWAGFGPRVGPALKVISLEDDCGGCTRKLNEENKVNK